MNASMNSCNRVAWYGTSRCFIYLVTAASLCCLIFLYACSDSDNATTATASRVALQETFTESARDLTPDLSTAAVNAWSGWRGDTDYTVLKKLFHPDSGWESVYGPLEAAESAITIIESNTSYLETAGTYEITGTSAGTLTMVVEDLTDGITVPYFNVTEASVTKKVVITSSDESMNLMIAYDMEGDDKAMVCHTKMVSGSETEYIVFRANYNETTQLLDIWAAGAADKTDAFKIQYHWKGNPDQNYFAITQYTNAAKEDNGSDGFWKVMGGGDINGSMVFRANTNDDPSSDYFIVTDLAGMTSETAPSGYPADSSTIDSSATEVQKYIDTANEACLGWLTGFPEVSDLTWNY